MRILERFFDMEWWIAIRPRQDSFELPMKFHVLKNTWRYWCADPFVFDYQGKTYVFMEVLDKTIQRGVIGYRVIEGGKVSKVKICLDNGHHMSYPMLFSKGNDIYMIPESFESGKLMVYRAVSFPDHWEPCETVFENRKVCDTNYLLWDEGEYLVTTPLGGEKFHYDKLELYYRNQNGWQPSTMNPLILGEDGARNGGHFFVHDGQLMRPSQNCANSYGEALLLNRVNKIGPEGYSEKLWKRIAVEDILPDWGRFDGIHTFNRSDSYDVVDLRKERSFQPARLIYFIRSKLRKKT